MDKVEKGSKTAKDGFKNEDNVISKFNNWKSDPYAKKWLKVMGYKLSKIEYVKAVKIFGYKSDIQVQISIKLKDILDVQNIQLKLVSNSNGYNQIDKRWVDKYKDLWDIPKDVSAILKLYTGELSPNIDCSRDHRRMFMDEFSNKEQNMLISWLNRNRALIINDILKGRGKFAAEWFLVIQNINDSYKWILKPINVVINFYNAGEISITNRGNIKIGKITMQRKGGDGGRNTANMLQFKLNPALLLAT